MSKEHSHIISTIVEHKPGVLYTVSNLFRRRGFNIDNISVGPAEEVGLARMTIMVRGDDRTIEQVIKQLNKLIDVIKVTRLNPEHSVTRELALIKVNAINTKARSDIINYADIFRARVVDVSPDSLMMELTGTSDKIDAFINLMKPFGVKEVARTGKTALSRGVKSVIIDD
ncbi:acetolactate synthase [miscellaneous Crenarchaeota group-1 archaeon SG8-32-1]|uniref:Acetolactate synthase small subunit n=1 Tax=miscellaneous Crenarchaeota group-1 archaeon SG8-32-1 TaxID=1685124 RepID=A0A0M0BYJ8_9ARCH|nr:MAG: acetolactate synthase [miscellaneous Crenarchaeota group-1 archaeon SG8-32-1]